MKLPIADQPSADPHGLDYDSPLFFDKPNLQSELTRVFEICNGCRLCYSLCPSFQVMLNRVDELDPHRHEAEGGMLQAGELMAEHEAAEKLRDVKVSTENPVHLLQNADYRKVVELCYECKLCYPKCPYVPPHEFAVDFPRLMLRAKTVWAKEEGIAFRERFLGATDLVGNLMTRIAPLANAAASSPLNRVLMEKTVGVHRDRVLPTYADESFATWWSRRAPVRAPEAPTAEVALFATCYNNYNNPEVAKAAVEVLEHAGCAVDCPEQVCCGMPKLDGGDVEGARALVRKNLALLGPAVAAGKKILSPGPSCTLMIKTEYPELVKTPESKALADATQDLGDFLLGLARAKKLPKDFKAPIGKVAFHVPCHNRVQNIGYRGRDLLKWAGAEVTLIDRCTGMDGTWGMKTEFFEESLKVADKAARQLDDVDPDVVVSDCPLAGLQLRQKTGRTAYHPILVLRGAYRGDVPRSRPAVPARAAKEDQ